jgi:UDP:flavonoid glycosyltransferase YjiC (YdhE family)
VGRAFWQGLSGLTNQGLEQGRTELNETRRILGLPPLAYVHGGISRSLALVATFPALEYERHWPPGVHVVGPLMWEPPSAEVELPPGDDPLVLVAPSTSQDPEQRLLEAALRGLADEPVRVLATWNRRHPGRVLRVPDNARVVEWVSYSRTMPLCDLVVCHAGHGTLVRTLSCGCPVVACPVGGDMNENAARIDRAGVGVRLPSRFIRPRALRLAARSALGDPSIRARARELAGWHAAHDSGATAAALVEELALSARTAPAQQTSPA